jgi:hypothetical protein
VAGSDAILGVSLSLKHLLEERSPVWVANTTPTVNLVFPHQIAKGISGAAGGYTICLYRVSITTSHRNQPPRTDAAGILHNPSVPLDLHYLITPWASSPDTQQRMLGWLVRELEDSRLFHGEPINALLPPSPAGTGSTCFTPGELVEVGFESLPLTEVFNLWDKLRQQLPPSVAYTARMVMIDSSVVIQEGQQVRTREFRLGGMPNEGAP